MNEETLPGFVDRCTRFVLQSPAQAGPEQYVVEMLSGTATAERVPVEHCDNESEEGGAVCVSKPEACELCRDGLAVRMRLPVFELPLVIPGVSYTVTSLVENQLVPMVFRHSDDVDGGEQIFSLFASAYGNAVVFGHPSDPETLVGERLNDDDRWRAAANFFLVPDADDPQSETRATLAVSYQLICPAPPAMTPPSELFDEIPGLGQGL